MVLLRSVMMFAMCIGCNPCPGRSDIGDSKEFSGVKIAMTTVDVNDTKLEVVWKIRNDTDHDVWVCDNITPGGPSGFDVVPAQDGRTLLLRRRFDLRGRINWEHSPWARYIRLGSGIEKTERIELNLPIRPYAMFDGPHEHGAHAEHLVLEIGYYNEDLPGMILHVVEVAEKVSPDIDVRDLTLGDFDVLDRFFPGCQVALTFNHDERFRTSVMSADDEVTIPYMRQVLPGEHVLRAAIADVSIHYAE